MPFKKTDTGIVHFISNQAGLWAELVGNETQISTERLLELADFGSVYLNDSRVFLNSEIKNQDYLRIHTQPRRFPRYSLIDRIEFETEKILIVDKPSGLPCHPTVDNLKENLWYDLQFQLQKVLYPTHRLDVPTSGLIFLAKTPEAQSEFQNLLHQKKVKKIYQALVPSPGPELGLHVHYMEKSPYAPKTISDTQRPSSQICQLQILGKQIFDKKTLLEIELITGRTHQIRAQLAFLGFPIIDDSLYSDSESTVNKQDKEIQLRCIYLRFPWENKEIEYRIKNDLVKNDN